MNFNSLDVAVLLTTFNGENYIQEQLYSIINQKNVKAKIYVHDDFSQDNTLQLIKKVQAEFPNRIFIIKSDTNLGVVQSYQFLLDNVEADYYFFSDQDDVWLDDKITKELGALTHKDESLPALVYSDLKIVDKNLNILSTSMFKKMKVSNTDRTEMLLVQNVITGNTVGFNKVLRNLIIKSFRMEDSKILMHDIWVGLVASLYGSIVFLDEPTVKYRQHGNNVVGAKRKKLSEIFNIRELKQAIFNTMLQAKVLEKNMLTYSGTNSSKIKKSVGLYANLITLSKTKRLWYCLIIPFRKQKFLRNIMFLFLVLIMKDSTE